MVEVGGSNPPGPTKIKHPPLSGFFSFGGVGLDENCCSTNATTGAFGPPQLRGGAQRVQASEATTLENNPPDPTHFPLRDHVPLDSPKIEQEKSVGRLLYSLGKQGLYSFFYRTRTSRP
jgi:hypothetical protein